MGNLNTCFDYGIMKETTNKLKEACDEVSLEAVGNNLDTDIGRLENYDKTHNVLSAHIDTLSSYIPKIKSISFISSNLSAATCA